MLFRQWAQIAAKSSVSLGVIAAVSERTAPRDTAASAAHSPLKRSKGAASQDQQNKAMSANKHKNRKAKKNEAGLP